MRKSSKEAQDAATTLAERMGPGWVPRVWENLGWHFSVVSACGRWKVQENKMNDVVRYTAFLGEPSSPGGWWAESGDTPELAVENTRNGALAYIKAEAALLDISVLERAELAAAEIEQLQEALADLRDMYDRAMARAEEAESEAAAHNADATQYEKDIAVLRAIVDQANAERDVLPDLHAGLIADAEAVTVNALLIEIRRLKQKEQALRGVLLDNHSRLAEAGQHYPWSSPSAAAHSCIDARALHGVVRQMRYIITEDDTHD